MASSSVNLAVKTEDKSSVIQAEQEVVVQQLKVFLDGATKISKVRSVEVAKAAICLLKNAWAASDAVLEHMDNLFDEAVNNYILSQDLEGSGNLAENVAADENIVQEIHKVLSEFIKCDAETWAPLISTWSLNLLGHLSSKHANRRVVGQSAADRRDFNLPEMLQLWMACCPTRTLIELTTQCLSTLINSNPDSCIDALIETSVLHSPHFDWVVAHIGSCFPMTVISRVLACGLKDFYSCPDNLEELPVTGKKRQKIESVVGILGHLALHHNADMRTAIRMLFNESLSDIATREQLATGPFLLKLASMSDILSDVISSEFVKVVTPVTLNVMSCQVEKWKAEKIPGTDGLVRVVVELLLRSDGGSQVIRRLLDIVPPSSIDMHSVIRDAAGLILDSVLLEIQRRVYKSNEDIPLLRFLKDHIADLSINLSETEGNKASWVFNLIKLICIYGGESFTLFVIGHLLGNTENVASYISSLAQEIQLSQPNALCLTISHQIAELNSGRVENPVMLIKNITNLCQLEQMQKLIKTGVGPNLDVLAAQISTQDPEYADTLIELMSLSVIPEQMPIATLFKVGSSATNYIFHLFSRKAVSPVMKIRLLNIAKCLLVKLSEQAATQHMILRMLLEGILDVKYAKFFGGKTSNLDKSNINSMDYKLLSENVKFMSSMTLPPNHCSVFYSGVIGSGLRARQKSMFLPDDEVLLNKQIVLDILQSCCKLSWRFPLDEVPNVHPMSLVSGMKVVALLLVELISPDVMFNGLPWPDEDYQKITIERDLQIKQMFEIHPILWDLLLLVATIHPSLCYCSVLLRAVMAVLISFWGSNQEKTTTNSPKQLEITQILISIMAIGQVLPPPLSYIDEVLPLVSPQEACSLLSDVWQYMRDNVPSPALFSTKDPNIPRMWRNFDSDGNTSSHCDKKYTKKLRYIMFENIEKFGSAYAKFFPIK